MRSAVSIAGTLARQNSRWFRTRRPIRRSATAQADGRLSGLKADAWLPPILLSRTGRCREERGEALPEHGRRRAFARLPLIDDGLPCRAHQRGQLRLAQPTRATQRTNLPVVVVGHAGPGQWRTTVHRLHRSPIVRPPKRPGCGGSCSSPEAAKGCPRVIGHRQPPVSRRRPQRFDVHADEQREHR